MCYETHALYNEYELTILNYCYKIFVNITYACNKSKVEIISNFDIQNLSFSFDSWTKNTLKIFHILSHPL